MRTVETDKAPRPAGHYSQGVVHGDTVYVAGQLPLDPDDPQAPPPQGIDAQARLALANVGAVLEAAGSDLSRLLQVTVYVADLSLWGELNRAYADVLGEHRPARAVVPTGPLIPGCLLEIAAVAALG